MHGHVGGLVDYEDVLVLPEHGEAGPGWREGALFLVADLDAERVARADGVEGLCGPAVEQDGALAVAQAGHQPGGEAQLALEYAAYAPSVALGRDGDGQPAAHSAARAAS